MRWTRLLAVARKETLQLRRDPRSLVLAFALPVLLLVIFGYAITFDVENVHTAVWDQDLSPASRELVAALEASGDFVVVAWLDGSRDVARVLDRGEVDLVLVVPPDFSRRLGGAGPATVQAVLDGSDANTATIVRSYLQGFVASLAFDLAPLAVDAAAGSQPVTADIRVWYNEELSSTHMIVPGLVAVIMMIIAAMLTSLTLAREWERGTMEQLASTPVTRTEVVVGKLLPYLAIGVLDTVLCAVLGVVLFGVPFRGSAMLFLGLSFLFLVGALGLGMVVSASTRTQLVASQTALIATFLPAFLLSGFLYDLAVMPLPLQLVTYLVPARYFLVVTRGIFLKGVGPEVLAIQGALMIAFAVAGLGLAVVRFKKELQP